MMGNMHRDNFSRITRLVSCNSSLETIDRIAEWGIDSKEGRFAIPNERLVERSVASEPLYLDMDGGCMLNKYGGHFTRETIYTPILLEVSGQCVSTLFLTIESIIHITKDFM